MIVRFYMSDDGEVLSNKDYPVDGPIVIVPEIGKPRQVYAYSEEEIKYSRIKKKVYRSYAVEFADGEKKEGR